MIDDNDRTPAMLRLAGTPRPATTETIAAAIGRELIDALTKDAKAAR